MKTMDHGEKKILLKTYFSTWKRRIRIKKEKNESMQRKLEQREKLENLVRALRKYKKEKQEEQENEVKPPIAKAVTVNNFKNRFVAQKNTIERLTLKLEEKDRLIQELKLGILDKEALKTIEETKYEIRELFAKCSTKVRCKVAPPPDYSEQFMVSTQKAPKILQEMEEKALERAKRRELILEKKREIEENRRRMIAEALEKKRVQDEEEKKKNLETIKERRRKELEREKMRQANKAIYMEKLRKATALNDRILLKRGFKKLFANYIESKKKEEKSDLHCKIILMSNALKHWKNFVEEKYKDKNDLADATFAKNILTKVLSTWREMRVERVRAAQVAEDFYDLLLLNKSFVHWHRHVCVQIMQREKQLKLAQNHYNRRILIHYFYLWRSLPAVIQLEKSKEQKKKKWRERVLEVLPDYKPPVDDFI